MFHQNTNVLPSFFFIPKNFFSFEFHKCISMSKNNNNGRIEKGETSLSRYVKRIIKSNLRVQELGSSVTRGQGRSYLSQPRNLRAAVDAKAISRTSHCLCRLAAASSKEMNTKLNRERVENVFS